MAREKRLPSDEPAGFFVAMVTEAGETTRRVDGATLTVGRSEGSDLIIPHETLSRRHLTLTLKQDIVYVEDHGSSNGTFVNGRRIPKKTPVALAPVDLISMGEAEVKLRVSLTEAPRRAATPVAVPAPTEEYEPTLSQYVPMPKLEPKAEPKPKPAPTQTKSYIGSTSTKTEAEAVFMPRVVPTPAPAPEPVPDRGVAEAQRRAAEIVTQAEVEAERRAQDILRRAHEALSNAEDGARKKMNEAYREAEQFAKSAEAQAREIVETARQGSGEIRAQAERYVAELRDRTKAECDQALDEAHRTALTMKQEKIEELARLERTRHDEASARSRAAIEEEAARRRAEIDAEMKASHDRHEALRQEVEALTEMKNQDRADLGLVRADLVLERQRVDEAREQRTKLKDEAATLEAATQALTKSREELDVRVKAAQSQMVTLNTEIEKAEQNLARARAESQAELDEIKRKLATERKRLEDEEALILENAKLETTRRTRDLELQMMMDLGAKREAIAREVALSIEIHLAGKGVRDVEVTSLDGEVRGVLDRQIQSIAQDDSQKRAQANLVAIKRGQQRKTFLIGLGTGLLVMFTGLRVQRILNADVSPMQRTVAAAQEERRQDREARRYAPPQSKGYKGSYYDNVILGKGFVATYTDAEFQGQLMRELAPYMLRVWRLDENKVIEALGITSALVTSLNEKFVNLNPDVLQKSLDEMKKSEADARARLREVLGSDVRLESFLKFEKEFYDRRAP